MADPLNENTQAQEQQTEALQELARSLEQAKEAFDKQHAAAETSNQFADAMRTLPGEMEHSLVKSMQEALEKGKKLPFADKPGMLEHKMHEAWEKGTARTFEDFRKIVAQHYGKPAPTPIIQPPPTPTPAPTPPPTSPLVPPPPTAPTPPPPTAPMARWATAAEVARHEEQAKPNKQPTPPPLSTPERMLHSSIGAAMERLNEMQDYLRSHPKARTSDLAARGLQGELRAHEEFIGKQYAGLSPEQQARANPVMQTLEERRRQVEEEELKRRERLNKELTRGAHALANFAHSAASGNMIGAGGAALSGLGGPAAIAGAVATALASAMLRYEMQYNGEVRRGGATLSPSLEDTKKASERLAEMREARRVGAAGQMSAEAYHQQLLGQARSMPEWRRSQDPEDLMRSPWGAAQTARTRAAAAFRRSLVSGEGTARAEQTYHEMINEYFQNWIREHGGKPQPFKQNIMMPGGEMTQGGITSAMGYQQELQVGTLQREDVTNEILREQLEFLREQGQLLENINNNINGLGGMAPRWE